MGIAVLNPQNCLKDPSFSRQPLISPPKSKPPSRNPNRRKRSPPPSTNQQAPARSTLDGRVRILKRGENIPSSSSVHESGARKAESRRDPHLGTTGRAPKSVPARAEPDSKVALFYAGSAFFTSPPPSSVPLPAFFTRKPAVAASDDATSGLRKLLRLDLQ